ncbi:MAG: amidohydrolase [Prevotellaceae bacterium]|jgi:hippurate hydrolase|nr:amidohydrolase [Prevotellaceae bacterium]
MQLIDIQIFKNLTEKYFETVKNHYRILHACPELSYEEFKTSQYIQNQLDRMKIPYRAGIAGTGILAKIEGQCGGKTIALRADMDALPVGEQTLLAYKSENEGIMHACGHDAHVACLLGAAEMLNTLRNDFAGKILLIFQPGEEKSPGGAKLMLDEGIFDDETPELIVAQHVSIDYPVGTLAFLSGRIMASADEIHVKIRGKGGHGALPHKINDTVLATAQVLVALQQVKSRLCHPLVPMVLTFGKFIANGATNLIPNEVQLSGTFRTLDEKWRQEAKNHIRRIINETAAAFGCIAEIIMPDGYPCVDNDFIITEKAREFAREFIGGENVKDLEVRLTAEDFGFFSQKFPATFFRFGVRGAANADTGELHSATFQIDENALRYGMGGMAWLAVKFLSEK